MLVRDFSLARPGVGDLTKKFSKKALKWTAIYFWGYFGLGVGWLTVPLMVSLLRYERRKESQLRISAAQSLGSGQEKEDLPSWVFFPDFERTEWLNRVIDQLWQSVGHFITHLLNTKVEPLIQKSLEGFSLKDFKFDHVLLGSSPPRIGGLKCYDKNYTSRSEIILDLEVSWASDCDISVHIKGMKASVRNLYVQGNLRVVLKPLMDTLPLFYFLTNPNIDFEVDGLANVAELPGMGSILRRVISEQLARVAVLPNKISIPLTEDLPLNVFKCPEPEGLLRLTIVEAKNLMHCDFGFFGSGQSDPYVVVSIGARKFKTRVIKKTVNPVFGEVWEVVVDTVKSESLEISVWDHDHNKEDDFMGSVRIPVQSLVERGEADLWVGLEEARSGQVRIRTEWFELSGEREDYEARQTETHGKQLATALLLLFIDGCHNLPLARPPGSTLPDPVVQVAVSGRSEVQKTRTVKWSRNPVYEERFVCLVNNPELDLLNLKVHDERSKTELGLVRLSLAALLDQKVMEFFKQPFRLTSSASSEAYITLHTQLYFTKKIFGGKKVLNCDSDNISVLSLGAESRAGSLGLKKMSVISSGSVESTALETVTLAEMDLDETLNSEMIGPKLLISLQYRNSQQILELTVHRASNLDRPAVHTPDPFVRIALLPDKSRRRKTDFVKESLEPVWEESFEFKVPAEQIPAKRIELVVLDRKGLFFRSAAFNKAVVELCELGDLTRGRATVWIPLSSLPGTNHPRTTAQTKLSH